MKQLLSKSPRYLAVVFLTILLLAPVISFAASDTGEEWGTASVLGPFRAVQYAATGKEVMPGIGAMVANGILILLTLLGVIFVVLIIYGGFLWMTAGGDAEQITKATGFIKNSVIGLAIVLAAYAITWFVLRKIFEIVTGKPGMVGY